MSILSLSTVLALSRYRWTIAILAALSGRGARFVEILNHVGLSRDSLSRALEQLIDAGWVIRNPGHGHPLRPEYLLTESGEALAQVASSIIRTQNRLEIPVKDMTRWTLPLVHVLAAGQTRFSGIERALPEASPRAVSLSLKATTAQRLVQRKVLDGFPPTTEYLLAKNGKYFAEALEVA
ncbi:winged helix-turn-helix transcriptional regulator [Sphingorhabdus sp. Alg231-15]|uniref:winged helix-turn-helix transcriptional regulator n=1 Tax=Sphingorhabdus sp. Alg231-15 TaxID=1922222 RepID=UPI000D557C3C